MREILFRGKDICDGWHYGDYEYITDDFVKITNHSLLEHGKKVEIETVGQYTGLTDKNGKKIFEGDIVRYLFGYNFTHLEKIGIVKYADGAYSIISDLENKDFEVIGNIYDNPDLLKGVRENENK